MGKPDTYIKRAIYNEKINRKKNIRFSKIKNFGTLIKNVRLKSVSNQHPSVPNSSCISSRVRILYEKKLRKCNRKVSYEENRVRTCQDLKAWGKMSEEEKPRKKILALVVYSRFLRKLWRKRKEMCDLQDMNLKSTTAQIKHMKIQLASLKSLLSSDERVMISSIREIKSLKSLLSNLQEEYTSVKTERENLEKKSENLQEEFSKMLTEFRNTKNNYLLAKSEAMAFEAQLEKEREKIAELKKDNRSLLNKIEKEIPSSSYMNDKKQKSVIDLEQLDVD